MFAGSREQNAFSLLSVYFISRAAAYFSRPKRDGQLYEVPDSCFVCVCVHIIVGVECVDVIATI